MNSSPTASPRLMLLPTQRQTGKRPAVRRYTLGRVVRDVDFGSHLLPVAQGAPASTGVRAP